MYIVVVGGGMVGFHLTRALFNAGHEVFVVDIDGKRVDELISHFGNIAIKGDGSEPSIQTAAGVARADILIATTSTDEDNLAACQLAKAKLGTITTLALPHLSGHHYNEFVVELPGPASECLDYLDSQGIIGGLDLSRWYPERKNWLLVSVTDQNSKAEINLLAAHLAAWSSAKIQGASE